MSDKIFRDEQGFTTLGMTVSLLLSLCLIFTSAQVYRINAASAQVQDVADSAALAAQTEVAEFMVVAQVCDAVVLSLSLASAVSTGVGVACLCVPVAAGLSEGFIEAGRSFAQAKNNLLKAAKTGLEAYQRALPYLAAVRAALVATSSNSGRSTSYAVLAISFPLQGEDIEIPDSSQDDQNFFDRVDQDSQQVKESSQDAEDAAQEALEAKQRGFDADCGAATCMRERASALAQLTGVQNPSYSSVDTWTFSVALERAKAYYQARLNNEQPASDQVIEGARSAIRKQYYQYACQELQKGYVYETESSFSAYFPCMPRNMQQMRQTSLYTQLVYPVTSDEQGQTMHAWSGCPNAAGYERCGSVQELENGEFIRCQLCNFQPENVGNVAAATSSVESGFEYHYLKVAQAAEDYQKARENLDPLLEQVRQDAQDLFDTCWDYAQKAQSGRIKVSPPGRYGAIALAFDCSSREISGSSLAGGSKQLGACVAVAGATLVADSSEEGATVITSLLDGLSDEAKTVMGPASLALNCWSGLLEAYGSGQTALISTLEDTLDGLPLIGASGLGTWAADALTETMERLGLEPASLQSLKPVLVNSSHVANACDGSLAQGYLKIKEGALEGAQTIDGVLSWSNTVLSSQKEGVSLVGSNLEIYQFSPFGDSGPTFSVSVPIPVGVQNVLDGILGRAAQGVNDIAQRIEGMVRWR